MEAVIILALFFALLFYVMLRGVTEEKREKQRYEERLRKQYGQFPNRQYTKEELEKRTGLFLRRRGTNSLDDITWNDLDMEHIFELTDHTQSSAGAEYLYDMLRCPKLNKKEVGDLEEHIAYLQEENEERIRLQMKLHELGTSGRYSIFDYLEYLDTLKSCSNKKHFFMLGMLLTAAAVIFVQTYLGVILLLISVCVNVTSYMKEKRTIQPYLASFSYLMRLLDCAEALGEEPLQKMPAYKKQLKDILGELSFIRKKYHYLAKMNATGGNPFDVVLIYFYMITHTDVIQFNRMVKVVRAKKTEIGRLAEAVGYLDAVISIGAFRASLPQYCVPQLSEGRSVGLQIKKGFHPAIRNPKVNSFTQQRGMLVTGSNASGKSTFLKMTAVNAVLAQTIHTCAAAEYCGGFYKIYSSMALRDNLSSGDSYYMVEIKALKRIVDAADTERENPILCFADEVLRGTNTVERIAASAQILEALSEKGVYCFAATHDIELTYLLEQRYDNYHFEEEMKNGDILFSYHLLKGRAQSKNAIGLLKVIGFSDEITQQAQARARRFMESGQWT